MSQNDFSIANADGATVRADLNNALQALASNSAGASEPGTTYAHQWWVDESNGLLKIRDATNTSWITVASKSGTTWIPYRSGTALGAPLEQGVRAIWIPASAMTARTTNGAAPGSNETTTNKVMYRTFDFDASTKEYAQFQIGMPKSWNEGTVTAAFCWTAASGSGNVIWGLQGLALSNDDALDQAFGTAQTATDTLISAGDVHWTSATSAVTIAGSPAAEDLVTFQVYRDADAGGDTLGVDAKLLGLRLYITLDAVNDA
jgi:hypothetical protein